MTDEAGVSERISFDVQIFRQLVLQAAELGFIGHEKGHSLERTRAAILALTNDCMETMRKAETSHGH